MSDKRTSGAMIRHPLRPRTPTGPRNALAALCMAGLTVSAAAAPPITENFDTGSEGWQIADMTCGGPYLNPISLLPLQWIATGGNPGGHIRAADPSSNCYYILANPAKFSGDLSAFAGGRIGWSIRCNVSNYALERSMLIVGTNNVVLAGTIDLPGINQWERRCVALDPASFRVGNQNGPAATQAQLDAVLASVHRIYLPAEFGAAIQEIVDIDSVEIRDACISDLNGDGVVNAADLGLLLAAFGSNPFGDMDCNGITDAGDLGILLSTFGMNCN